jgi:hypothetical protein
MANITKYLEKALLAQSVGVTNPTNNNNFSVSGTYAALFTTSPTADYTSTYPDGVEVSNSIGSPVYTRQAITWGTAMNNVDQTNSSKIQNTNSIVWTASGNWGTVTTIGIFDNSNVGSGNLLWFGPLSASATLGSSGDTLTLSSGTLTLTLA